ncbi:hypothetical protein BGZ72_001181 [Mortierella alpina]|nr:hypothetical protein BGZ72_001181 [Mortierella alpina]
MGRREDTIYRHLRRWYSESEDFLKQLNSILLEAALATEPDLIRKMRSSREQAARIMETFMVEHPTVAHDQIEQQDTHKQLSQPEAVNEQERQQNNGEPSCHPSLNVSSELSRTTEPRLQYRKRKAQCLDHAVSDLLLKAALGGTILKDSPESPGAAKLRYVLDLMRVGRFRRAIEDITGCWDLDDCQVLVQYGVAIFQQQKINEDSGYMSLVKHIGRLTREGLPERFIDLEKQADLVKSLVTPDKAIQTNHSKPSMILWFYWMRSPYMVTSKLIVKENVDAQSRAEHLAYLVCYWNSYDTRKRMDKLEAEDAQDSSKSPVAFDLDNGPWNRSRRLIVGGDQDRPSPEKKPISFRQEANYDLYAADQDVSLRSLHYWLLSDRDTDELHEEQGLEDLEDYDSAQPSGNHMIVIMPFAGYVWEIDSYHSDSPLCLGVIKNNWKYVAQERLQMWTEAAIESRVCNDVHAIVRE